MTTGFIPNAREELPDENVAIADAEAPLAPRDMVVRTFRVAQKAQLRLGFELDSARVGTLRRGITVSALEVRPTDAPEVFRVRLRGGWVSTQAATGKAILEPVSGGDFALGSDGPGHPRGG